MATITRATDIATAWVDGWNRHDPAAITACLTAGGTYVDPAPPPISGEALAGYASVYFQAFPDLVFDTLNLVDGGSGVVALHWRARGTHNGPLGEVAPTGKVLSLSGVDIITVDGDHIRSVEGYWDQLGFQQQLGLAAG
jgi:steroid delta-isomerase-like uncharacterized protein